MVSLFYGYGMQDHDYSLIRPLPSLLLPHFLDVHPAAPSTDSLVTRPIPALAVISIVLTYVVIALAHSNIFAYFAAAFFYRRIPLSL